MRDTIRGNIENHGRHLFGIFYANPSFVYSVGNHENGMPELILLGDFPPAFVATILNRLSEYQSEHGPLEAGMLTVEPFPLPFMVHIPSQRVKDDFTIQTTGYYGHDNYEVRQIALCDKEKRYPGDAGCDPAFNVPLL